MNDKNRLKILMEDVLGIRIKGRKSKKHDFSVDYLHPLGEFLEDLEGSKMCDLSDLNSFRTMSSDRETQYQIYDEMEKDSIISTALQMYADDATQYNAKGQIIWAESEDTDIAAFANRLIDVLGLNSNAWSHIYSLCKYGDVYLETFRDSEIEDDPLIQKSISISRDIVIDKFKKGTIIEEYVEMVSNPAEVFDLTKRGKTVGFIKVPSDEASKRNGESTTHIINFASNENKTEILPPDKYVHISLSSYSDRFPEEINITFEENSDTNTDNTSNIRVSTYNINRGRSVLYNLYKIWKELGLLEDSLLLNRVTRSSITRILQVEVGDMPKAQARELLKRVKQMLEQKNFMDKGNQSYQSFASPGPIDNIIYVPTHNGKGNITASNIGGDVDVKSIADVDYYKSKLAGALKIPLAYLTGESNDSGGFGTALTKLDSRYARTIKRIQSAYIAGITTLINIYAVSRGLTDHINNFTIKMVSPSTIEDQDRDESLDNRVNIIGNFMSLLNDYEYDSETMRQVLMYFMSNFINEPEIAEILENANIKLKKKNNKDNLDSSPDTDVDISFEGGDTNFSKPDTSSLDTGGSDDFSDTEFDTDSSIEDVSTDTDMTSEYGDFADEI